VVTAHSTMTTGRPLSPVSRVTICWRAESSATMYRNMVMSVQTLRNNPPMAP
jgi:predicted aconitase